MTASTKLMELLHSAVATELLEIIKASTDEEGRPSPAAASYFQAAIKFLKDNGIDSIADKSPELSELAKASLPKFSDDDEVPLRPN